MNYEECVKVCNDGFTRNISRVNTKNCVECVKDLVDNDLYDLIRNYKINQNCYEVTKNDIYKHECEVIKQELQYIAFDNDIDALISMPFNQLLDKVTMYQYNKRKVRNRLSKRIRLFFSKVNDDYAVYFVTLTFRDAYLKNKDYFTIRKSIREFVGSRVVYYILNKDYGELHDRLHFHGVILIKRSNIDDFEKDYHNKYGFVNTQLCNENSTAISLYIEKLTLHALKLNTKKEYREHIIYSRLDADDRKELEDIKSSTRIKSFKMSTEERLNYKVQAISLLKGMR